MGSVPDGEDATGLGKARLLLDTANPLLQDGGHLGWGSLRIGGVGPGEDAGDGCGISCLGKVGVSRKSENVAMRKCVRECTDGE